MNSSEVGSQGTPNIAELCDEISGLPIDYDLESLEVILRYASNISKLCDDDYELVEEYLNL